MQIKQDINVFKKFQNYIPYAFHYNHHSILTKNGELIFVIKLNNFIDDKYKKIIINSFNSDSFEPYSIYITTINEKIELNPIKNNKSSLEIEDELNKIFSLGGFDNDRFKKEIYISFIFNDNINIQDFKFNISSFINFSRNNYSKKLTKLYKKSLSTVLSFITNLRLYSPAILSIQNDDHNKIFYCEILDFFSKINFIKLDKYSEIKLGFNDLSLYLSEVNNFEYEIINKNIIRVTNKQIEKYCSLFSLKTNNNADYASYNSSKLLDNNFEFISTEILIKTQKKQILNIKDKSYNEYIKKYKEQKEYFDISEDNDLIKDFLINENESLEKKNKNISENFILKKNIFCIKASSIEDLFIFSRNFFNKIYSKGFFIKRENIFIDQIFWSQMPGNFIFFDKIYISKKTDALFFNNFTISNNEWLENFVFRNKSANFFNKINLNLKKFFLLSSNDLEINYLDYFFLYLSRHYNLKIEYINYEKNFFNLIYKNFNKNTDKDEKISSNISIDLIFDTESDKKKKIRQIFDIVFSVLKILFYMNFFNLNNNEENHPVENQELNDDQILKIKNISKRISIDIFSKNEKVNFNEILNIFIKNNIFLNNQEVYNILNKINNKKSIINYNFYIDNNEEFFDSKILLIFILFKILEQYSFNNYILLLNYNIIYIINFDSFMELNNLKKIFNEIFNIIKNQNIFLLLNLKKQNIKDNIKLYNEINNYSTLFSFNRDAKNIIEVTNPKFSSNPNFFTNIMVIVNNYKFFINEFPEEKINNLFEKYK
jgi:hypothetical protein